MPHEPTDGIPARLIAGDTWRWSRAVSDHTPSGGWTLRYEFSISNDDVFGVDASADGDSFLLVVAAGVTRTLQPGVWRWAEVLTKSGERYTIASGKIEVWAVFHESQAEYWVRKLREALSALIDGNVQSVQINGRVRTMLDLETLRKMLKEAEAQVEQESTPGRLGPQVAAVFRTPGFPGAYPFPPFPHGGSL